MTTALAYLALIACLAAIAWLCGRKAARIETELKYAKEYSKRQANSAEILNNYINLNGSELAERVRKKREAAKQRLLGPDRLD